MENGNKLENKAPKGEKNGKQQKLCNIAIAAILVVAIVLAGVFLLPDMVGKNEDTGSDQFTEGEVILLDNRKIAPIQTGAWGNCHIQGIAVDIKNGYIYYSFTTKLIKATLDGEIVGTLDGLAGHLGCIAFNESDGCVYGSLEYKNDVIGKDILEVIGSERTFEDAFYVVKFDVDKITEPNMSTENTDIMSAVCLYEVEKDYKWKGKDTDGNALEHKYGCSGIDGLTFGPLPGKSVDDGMYLYVAYGIYNDVSREDNDYQILLCYDMEEWEKYALPLSQNNMHKSGFEKPLHKFFVYTGNTEYGVQNLEYDKHTNSLFMAVYKGFKENFPNYTLFNVDLSVQPQTKELKGIDETAEVLSLSQKGLYDEKTGVYGWYFPLGSTGLFSFGDGDWLICRHFRTDEGQCGEIEHYIWDEKTPFIKKK